jgi:hypothetical protein
MERFVQKIVGRKIESQDFNSDDDVLAIIDSDSDFLETIGLKRPILLNFLMMTVQLWQGLKRS